jgi:hypothetical protein
MEGQSSLDWEEQVEEVMLVEEVQEAILGPGVRLAFGILM